MCLIEMSAPEDREGNVWAWSATAGSVVRFSLSVCVGVMVEPSGMRAVSKF